MNRTNKKKRSTFFSEFFGKSLILSYLTRFSAFLYQHFSESFFGYLLCGNRQTGKNGILHHLSEKIRFKQRISVPFKRFLSRGFERSFLLNSLQSRIKSALDLPVKTVGVFYFAFSLYVSVSYLVRYYALGQPGGNFSELYLGIVCAVASGILISSSKKCATAITESRILSFLLFRVLGIQKEKLVSTNRTAGRGDVAFFLGIAAGALASLTSPKLIVFGIPLLILAYIILMIPECGVVCLLLALPFLPTMYAAVLCIYVTVCWLLKLMRGKRVLALNTLDASVFAFAAVLLVGGIVSVTPTESIKSALLYVCLMSGYFLAVNLIRTSDWFYRCLRAILFSLSVTAIIGVIEYVSGASPFAWLDTSLFSYIPGRAVSLFENPNVLAEFLNLTLPFLLISLFTAKKGDTRFGLMVLTLLTLLCLAFTWSRGGWIAAILGMAFLLLLCNKKAIGWLLGAVLLLPFLTLILPEGVTARLMSSFTLSDSSVSYRFGIWSGVDKLLSDCFAGGIGVGEAAFRRVYPIYALNSIESAPHTHNLYTQISVSVGITGLVVFLAMLLIFLRHCMSYFAGSQEDELRLRFSAAAGLSGVVSLLIQGFTDYVWYNNRIFLLFWLILGLTSAAIRIGVRERIPSVPEGPCLDIDIKDLQRSPH